MKIKVGDLTIKENHNLCEKLPCNKCPLYVKDRKSPHILRNICAASYPRSYDILVDVPDEYLENRKRFSLKTKIFKFFKRQKGEK